MTKTRWTKVRAGEYSTRVGDRQRIDIDLRHHALVSQDRWHVSDVTEGEKSWMRDTKVEWDRTYPTLRAAKAAVVARACPCHAHGLFPNHRCTPLCSHSVPECVVVEET